MAYKAKYYDKKTLTERVWHISSMIKYTEMVENPDENVGDLTVVFNNGSTYKYKDVALSDYVLMVGGGIDASNGKTFNQVIKTRGYEYEKLDPMPQEEMDRKYSELVRKQTDRYSTYFISGPEDFTEQEFDYYIAQKLSSVFDEGGEDEARFILSDSEKFGLRVQEYLIDILGVEPENITVCTLGNDSPHIHNAAVQVSGGFASETDMDEDMTYWSIADITILHDWENTITRQSKNILRRYARS